MKESLLLGGKEVGRTYGMCYSGRATPVTDATVAAEEEESVSEGGIRSWFQDSALREVRTVLRQ